MKVLVACEFSGIVRDAFLAEGHDAISCDLLPTERPGPHIQGDVRDLLREPWDLVIAHPPCNYLTHYTWTFKNHERIPEWWQRYKEGMHFFRECLNANAPLVAVENPPQMHPPAKHIFGEPTQWTDFRYFASHYRKAVGLWLRGLPPLMAVAVNPNAQSVVRHNPSEKLRAMNPNWANLSGKHTDSKLRAHFDPGMAAAMARQWGNGGRGLTTADTPR